MTKKRRGTMRTLWALAALLACGTGEAGVVASPQESETTQNASSLPDPGDDWILRAKNENDEENALAAVAAVGRIVEVGPNGIETEDRRRDRRERTAKRPGDAILFLPPVDPSAAEAFCGEIRAASGARNRDRFWLRNGDEFDGELLKVDRRRVWVRAFNVEFAVPRGRVRAVRFAATVDENDKIEKSGEE
jgi:hypothetical protein